MIKALCRGLPSSETMYGKIDTGKAAKCQGSLVLYWFSAQLQYKSVRDIVWYFKEAFSTCDRKTCEDFEKA